MGLTYNRRLARRWMAVNAIGVALSIAIEEYLFFQHVNAHDYNPPRAGHLQFVLIWLVFMVVLGAGQAVICGWLLSFVKIRNQTVQIASGFGLGLLTAVLVPVLGAWLFFWVPAYFGEFHYGAEPLIGICVFLISGTVFGPVAGYCQSSLYSKNERRW